MYTHILLFIHKVKNKLKEPLIGLALNSTEEKFLYLEAEPLFLKQVQLEPFCNLLNFKRGGMHLLKQIRQIILFRRLEGFSIIGLTVLYRSMYDICKQYMTLLFVVHFVQFIK